MKFELRSKSDDEVIDVLEIHDVDIKGAKAYFMARKMLEEKDFDEIFRVKPNPPVGRYKWWEEESSKLDDF
tara:strand:- start:741 stop:953 length:213 start_codon:yes stop_codon:yes gene_type:complete